jgi:hypothetical protein
MPKLYVGFDRNVELPEGGCLLIDSEARKLPDTRGPKIFDAFKHGFKILDGMDYRKATDVVGAIMDVFPGGETTLTKEGAEQVLLEALLDNPKSLDGLIIKSKDPSQEKARRMIERLLLSPIIRQMLCESNEFKFSPRQAVMARLNRNELGDFDAFAIGQFLMSFYKGHIIVPDFGFYGRERHLNLISQGRLTVGVNFLGELSPKLRNGVFLIKDKVVAGATVEDAETLARIAGMVPGTVEYNDFIDAATGENRVMVQG